MFHFTTQTHRPTMVLVGGYIKCILLKDVFRKNNDTSFLKRRSNFLGGAAVHDFAHAHDAPGP